MMVMLLMMILWSNQEYDDNDYLEDGDYNKYDWYESDKKNVIKYASNRAIKIKKEEPLKKELLTFINCIKNSKKPYTDVKEALSVQKVLTMIDIEIKNKYELK